MHADAHPDDAGRRIDGVVANQCLMDTMGFADGLSSAGVRYLAASPETMFAPGVPSDVAHVSHRNENDPTAMAQGVVRDVMHTSTPPATSADSARPRRSTCSTSIRRKCAARKARSSD